MDNIKKTPNFVKCMDCGYDGFDKINGTFYCARCGNVAEDIAEREMDYTQFDHIDNWTPFDIMKFHEVCFPLADYKSQDKRIDIEIEEYREKEAIEEMADCYISTIGLGRFSLDLLPIVEFISYNTNETEWSIVKKSINDKMKINLQRWKDGEWIWDDSTQQYKRG